MARQIAYVRPMTVKNGVVVDKNDPATKLSDLLDDTTSEMRIVAESSKATTANNPTIEAYLLAEYAAGRTTLAHMSNTMIVTQ